MKWIKCADRLPPNPKDYSELKDYLVAIKLSGGLMGYYVVSWADGWNCTMDHDGNINKDHELTSVVAWTELTPYEEDK